MLVSSTKTRSDRLDFETHLKYVSLIEKLSRDLMILSTINPKLKKSDINKLKDKIQLVKLTKASIDQEHEIVAFDKDYSSASVLWLPIKTYYLLYHLLCITDCLITGKISALTAGHHDCISTFNEMLKKSEMIFNKPLLNNSFDHTILKFVSEPGEHLRNDAQDDRVYNLLMKKVASGKIDNYKTINGLSGRRLKDRIRIEKFTKNMEISIFDFFLLMRVRMNYRNLNFIDNISTSDTKVYFDKYFDSANNFYKCFSSYVNKLINLCP